MVEASLGTYITYVLVAIFGTGIALAGLILPDLRSMKRDIADLGERMARLEGLFEGFTRRDNNPDVAS
ncbi:MAG: hypothetical protein OXK20_00080 [Deltaproteobacteria bacterium]|nr:hypothetical protein [Deltaproteobacteria bacterium]